MFTDLAEPSIRQYTTDVGVENVPVHIARKERSSLIFLHFSPELLERECQSTTDVY